MRLSALLLLVSACVSVGDNPRAPGGSGGTGGAGGDTPVTYATVLELHEKAIARTCALNGGVCHNSKEYPDLHNVSNLFDTMMRPCNVAALRHEDVHDSCEPAGDHIVLPALGIDAEVATVAYDPTTPTLALAAPVASTGMAPDVEVHRGALTFALVGATATVIDPRTIALDLSAASDSVRSFLDDRVYPWTESMIRVADVNRNGILGHSLGFALITPGQTDRSYLLQRLVDDTQGDLMPRQCREWTQAATRALGCWIEGLAVDGGGQLTNAAAPIDYAHCHFDPSARGRCVNNTPTGSFGAVEAVFARNCAGSNCHVGEATPRAGLDLSPGRAFASLVGVASSEVPSLLRVAPASADASYLVCKVSASCAQRVGDRMPAGAPALSDADIGAIKAWISGGAHP